MKQTSWLFALIAAASLSAAAAEHSGARQLDVVFEQMFEKSKVTGVSACLSSPTDGLWCSAAGVESRESGRPITTASRLHAGSIGKLVTAALVFELIEEQRFSLDTKLSRWFPKSRMAQRLTIDHLLSHTGGLPQTIDDQPGFNTLTAADRAIRALEQKLSFKPGSAFSYSNSGYLILGVIVERERGKPLAEVVEERFVRPLELADSKAITSARLPELLVESTHQGKSGRLTIDYAAPAGAGMLASTPHDLVRALGALLAGQLISPGNVESMLEPLRPMNAERTLHWGRGLMRLDMPLGQMTYLAGRIKGFGAMVGLHRATGTIVSVMVNDDTPVEPFMFGLLQATQPN